MGVCLKDGKGVRKEDGGNVRLGRIVGVRWAEEMMGVGTGVQYPRGCIFKSAYLLMPRSRGLFPGCLELVAGSHEASGASERRLSKRVTRLSLFT